ncbi:MAG: hypothetical protein Q8O67_09920 [Deltaproteobacteria bacterium]|nr:hypothetical protein [Deltaproteobacteria bacterium]
MPHFSQLPPLRAARRLVVVVAAMALPASAQTAPEEPYQELPILTWQQEADLHSTVRQVLMNAYLPFLARPTDYRGVHNDAIPNQVSDWSWQRDDVKSQLRGRQDDVDAKRRGHGGLPDAEINALISKKQAFRPEELERLLTGSPRLNDIIVKVNRVQPLGPTGTGGEVYRVDFEVKTLAGNLSENTVFERIDLVNDASRWVLPTNIIFDVAPLARATAAATAGGGVNPIALAQATIEVVLKQVRDISPIPIPKIPGLEP